MTDKPIYYWDACLFYEVVGNESIPATQKTAIEEILAANEKKENTIITSVISHLEVLPNKLTAKGVDEADYLALFDAEHFVEIQIDTNILLRAREIRDFYSTPADANGQNSKWMDLGDAIHLATASIHGVTAFHSRDSKKKGSKVPLVGLYDLVGHDKLCGKYDLKIVSPESMQGALDVLQTDNPPRDTVPLKE